MIYLWIGIAGVFCAGPVQAQTQLVSSDYFPAEMEFRELQKVRAEKSAGERSVAPSHSEESLFGEAGYLRYARRSYDTEGGGILTIEVVRTKDAHAAYSLLTLLRKAPITQGPPGESFSAGGDALVFAAGNFWVRVQGAERGDLLKRVALSVSNRIGSRERATPSLISHFPRNGLEMSSARYFLGPKSFDLYANKIPGLQLRFLPEMEVAQADYNWRNRSGVLSLLSFPTAQIAGDYFDRLSDIIPPANQSFFVRRVGPIVGVLSGGFDAPTADEVLGGIKFSYSIKWIYDKNNRSSGTVWGVPVGILGTVVRSLLLTMLLCGLSVLLGVGLALFRIFLRGYAPGNFLDAPERTEMVRLRLNEDRVSSAGPALGRGQTETK